MPVGQNSPAIHLGGEEHLHNLVDELVLNAVKGLQSLWTPAISDGQYIDSRRKVTIRFTYQESLNYTGSQRKMVYIDRPLGHIEKPHNYK